MIKRKYFLCIRCSCQDFEKNKTEILQNGSIKSCFVKELLNLAVPRLLLQCCLTYIGCKAKLSTWHLAAKFQLIVNN